jgi:sterol desaturase/sphingolipid hydroxylase (fatty acid hydroxylase superfamily)
MAKGCHTAVDTAGGKPEQRIFSTWPVYKFLARYHWLHHRYRDKNFNVVFPFADYVLGTSVRANAADLKRMQHAGSC